MKKHILALLIGLLVAFPAFAANVNIDGLPAAASVAGANLLECEQGGINRKCTATQTAAFIHGLMSGDCTTTGPGVITCTATNGVVFGTLATIVPGTGVATALGVNIGSAGAPVLLNGAGGTPSAITLTNGTGLPIAGTTGWGTGVATALANPINATSGFVTYALASTSAFGLVKVDGTTVTATGGVISSVSGGAGTVTSVSAGCGTSTGGSPITTTGTVAAAITTRAVTGTTDAIVATDCGNLVTESNAGAVAVAIAQAGTTGFASGSYFQVCNKGVGAATITPTTSTIGGAATFVLPAATAANPACVIITSDGTNYGVAPEFTVNAGYLTAGILAAARGGAGTINGALKGNGSGVVSQAACADLSNGTTLCSTTPGTGVATAAAVALSAAGGLTTTVSSGAKALAISAIASAACSAAQTDTATNTATTDVVLASFNGDPTAVTGYIPLVAGMLTIVAYPTANAVNFKVCNNTSSSITPGAITLNWRVVR